MSLCLTPGLLPSVFMHTYGHCIACTIYSLLTTYASVVESETVPCIYSTCMLVPYHLYAYSPSYALYPYSARHFVLKALFSAHSTIWSMVPIDLLHRQTLSHSRLAGPRSPHFLKSHRLTCIFGASLIGIFKLFLYPTGTGYFLNRHIKHTEVQNLYRSKIFHENDYVFRLPIGVEKEYTLKPGIGLMYTDQVT